MTNSPLKSVFNALKTVEETSMWRGISPDRKEKITQSVIKNFKKENNLYTDGSRAAELSARLYKNKNSKEIERSQDFKDIKNNLDYFESAEEIISTEIVPKYEKKTNLSRNIILKGLIPLLAVVASTSLLTWVGAGGLAISVSFLFCFAFLCLTNVLNYKKYLNDKKEFDKVLRYSKDLRDYIRAVNNYFRMIADNYSEYKIAKAKETVEEEAKTLTRAMPGDLSFAQIKERCEERTLLATEDTMTKYRFAEFDKRIAEVKVKEEEIIEDEEELVKLRLQA